MLVKDPVVVPLTPLPAGDGGGLCLGLVFPLLAGDGCSSSCFCKVDCDGDGGKDGEQVNLTSLNFSLL